MTNEIADLVKEFLDTKHSRVYRNKSIKSPTFPYIVYRVERAVDSYPTSDYSLVINVIDKNDGTVSVRTIEDLADEINNELNTYVFTSTNYNLHFTMDNRQFDDDDSLAGVQLVNLQYTIRVY